MYSISIRVALAVVLLATLGDTTALAQTAQQRTSAEEKPIIVSLKWGPASRSPNNNMFFTDMLLSVSYTSQQAPGMVSVLVSITTPVDRLGEVDCFTSLDSRSGVLAPQLLNMGPLAALGNAETGRPPVYSADPIPVTIAIYAVSKADSGESKRGQLISNVLKGTLHRDNNSLYFFTQHPQRTESLSFDVPK